MPSCWIYICNFLFKYCAIFNQMKMENSYLLLQSQMVCEHKYSFKRYLLSRKIRGTHTHNVARTHAHTTTGSQGEKAISKAILINFLLIMRNNFFQRFIPIQFELYVARLFTNIFLAYTVQIIVYSTYSLLKQNVWAKIMFWIVWRNRPKYILFHFNEYHPK